MIFLSCDSEVKVETVKGAKDCANDPLTGSCLESTLDVTDGGRGLPNGMVLQENVRDFYVNLSDRESSQPFFSYTPPSGLTVFYSDLISASFSTPCDHATFNR